MATTCQAQGDHLYCVDKSTSEIVAQENCEDEGDLGDFSLIKGTADAEVGSVIEGRDLTEEEEKLLEQLKVIRDFGDRVAAMKVAVGGFGKAGDKCDCHAPGGYRGGVGAGGVIFAGGGGGRRPGGSRGS